MSEERQRLAAELKRAFAALPTAITTATATVTTAATIEGSISFTMPLLKAVLSGHKTMTRRPVRPVPTRVENSVPMLADGSAITPIAREGSRLWVREKWAKLDEGRFAYAVDDPSRKAKWISSRYMPRAAARNWLSVQRIAVARLSEISDEDAVAEGATADADANLDDPRAWFLRTWDSIYGDSEFAVARDPWVWVVQFTLAVADT